MHDKYKKDVEAYADGEMEEQQERRFSETLKSFPTLEEYLKKLEHQKLLLKKWWEEQKYH